MSCTSEKRAALGSWFSSRSLSTYHESCIVQFQGFWLLVCRQQNLLPLYFGCLVVPGPTITAVRLVLHGIFLWYGVWVIITSHPPCRSIHGNLYATSCCLQPFPFLSFSWVYVPLYCLFPLVFPLHLAVRSSVLRTDLVAISLPYLTAEFQSTPALS